MTAIEDTQAAARPGGLAREAAETARTLGAGLALALALRVIVFQP